MTERLPKFVVLKSVGYAYFTNESESERGYVKCTEESVFEPYAKIEVELAKINHKYVHLRFCASNKYWAQPSPGDSWILAESDEPDEDVSELSCTLFEPIINNGLIYFNHVQSGGKVAKDTDTSRLRVTDFGFDYFSFVDWETLVKLPKRVCFKGNNDLYVRDFRPADHSFLQVSSKDGNGDITAFEVQLQPDGQVRVKSVHLNKFWRRSPNWIWADSEDETGQDKDTLFWPVKIDDKTVALRNAGNDNFIIPLTTDGKEDCLNAAVATITNEAKFKVEELVLERSIYNIEYRMQDSRIYDATPFVAGVGTANNESNTESSLTILINFQETTSYSFTNSLAITIGVSTEITAGIPGIVGGKIEVSAEVTDTLEWSKETTETKSVSASYTLKVPPKSRATVSYVGTKGKCDVPFSYTQRDKSSLDGQIIKSRHIDGIFNGVSCYNYHFVEHALTPL